jgi:hypothetical protein
MWICRNCNLQRPPIAFTPELDESGWFFLCPGCWHRNALIGIREEDGPLEMIQPRLARSSVKPWKG